MSTGLAQLEERIAKLEEAAEDIRDATREAHAATKDLRRLQKEVRDLLGADAKELVENALDAAVKTGLAEYGTTIRAAQDRALEVIQTEFNKLADLYLEGNGRDREHIAIAAHEARATRQRALADLDVRDLTGGPL
jgi:predicted transcriptional regulator